MLEHLGSVEVERRDGRGLAERAVKAGASLDDEPVALAERAVDARQLGGRNAGERDAMDRHAADLVAVVDGALGPDEDDALLSFPRANYDADLVADRRVAQVVLVDEGAGNCGCWHLLSPNVLASRGGVASSERLCVVNYSRMLY